MDTRGFESALYRLSIKAIHALSGNTQDVITIQEAIERNAYFRPKLYCVQIWSVDFKKVDGYCDIHFILSPDFMIENADLTLTGKLHQLKWVFEIQRYDYGEDDEGNKISEEDGIDNWLIKSRIKVNYEQINIEGIELINFVTAIHITESD
jgi:hypothetical protein